MEVGDPRFGKLIRCGCRAREDAERLNRLSGLTPTERAIRLEHVVTDDLQYTARMVGACKKFITSPRGIITIHGGPGNGKTMVLQAVINAMLDQNIEAVYVTAFDLISHIRDAFSLDRKTKSLTINDDSAYSRLQRYERVRVLAVDELDKIKVTDWVLEQLTDLIDRRYRMAEDNAGGTLIAMNESPDFLPAWIASRLKRYTVIHNGDEDMRPEFGQYEMEM